MTTKPVYQPWSEESFSSDIDVQALSAMQRWMYRTLCQKAFVCSTRPFPPDDDGILWKLSGCPSRAVWDQHKESVKAMFVPRIVNEIPVLFRQRLDDDWTKLQGIRDARRESAGGRWGSESTGSRSERLAAARKLGTHTREDFQEMVVFFNGTCVRCGNEGDIVRDHITPIYQGGSDGIFNLQPLCSKCNLSKGKENIDYRVLHALASEMPVKWLENACKTPAKGLQTPASGLQVSKEVSKVIKPSSKDIVRKPHESHDLPGFTVFWMAYPRKVAKQRALRAWCSKVRVDAEWPDVLKGLEKWKLCRQWQEPQFIPHPSTFLNGEQWKDEPITERASTNERQKPRTRTDGNAEALNRVFGGAKTGDGPDRRDPERAAFGHENRRLLGSVIESGHARRTDPHGISPRPQDIEVVPKTERSS